MGESTKVCNAVCYQWGTCFYMHAQVLIHGKELKSCFIVEGIEHASGWWGCSRNTTPWSYYIHTTSTRHSPLILRTCIAICFRSSSDKWSGNEMLTWPCGPTITYAAAGSAGNSPPTVPSTIPGLLGSCPIIVGGKNVLG